MTEALRIGNIIHLKFGQHQNNAWHNAKTAPSREYKLIKTSNFISDKALASLRLLSPTVASRHPHMLKSFPSTAKWPETLKHWFYRVLFSHKWLKVSLGGRAQCSVCGVPLRLCECMCYNQWICALNSGRPRFEPLFISLKLDISSISCRQF